MQHCSSSDSSEYETFAELLTMKEFKKPVASDFLKTFEGKSILQALKLETLDVHYSSFPKNIAKAIFIKADSKESTTFGIYPEDYLPWKENLNISLYRGLK